MADIEKDNCGCEITQRDLFVVIHPNRLKSKDWRRLMEEHWYHWIKSKMLPTQ